MSGPPALRFYPAKSSGAALPLARYLPPLPQGMASAWLAENLPPGAWVLDPLGSTPALALEAARAGYRVIVASNNPILSFLLEVLSENHRPADFQAALAELALAKRGSERLDRHIQNLYETLCSRCGDVVAAQAYLWRKGEDQPFARLARCPKCGEDGEQPVTDFDLERLALVGNDALHRSRALQRVIMNEDEYREDVEQALENYLPRPLYILFTLINRLEGLSLPPERARLMQALMVSAFDAGSTLWPWPAGRARPRQLTLPPQFRENNLWDALENAAADWSAQAGAPPVAFTRWPELPPAQGGICLFRGRVKGLVPLPAEVGPQAIVTVFPRPNQAFWTLSALWSGWLWGREAALPIRSVLDRRRYDWNWHTSALHSVLSALSHSVPAQAPLFGLLPDLAPGFLTAALAAGEASGFRLESLSLQAEEGIAQALWRPSARTAPTPAAPAPSSLEHTARDAIRTALLERAEPASYLALYAAGLAALARARAIPESGPGMPGEVFTRLQAALVRPFSDRSFLRFYPAGGSHAAPRSGPAPLPADPAEDERGWWWLADDREPPWEQGSPLPLADRVEMDVVRFLQKQQVTTLEALQQALSVSFPGLLAPSVELLHACMDSYAEPVLKTPGTWRIRAGELPALRRADLQEARAILLETGRKLGLSAAETGESAVEWQPGWAFYLMASSIASRFVLAPPLPGVKRVLVLPGGRSRLLAFKLRRDPRLAGAMKGWRILKFRHLRGIGRQLGEQENASIESWESLLGQDPLTEEATQMPLFG